MRRPFSASLFFSLAFIALSPDPARAAAPLASWVYHKFGDCIKYSATLDGGSLIVREENPSGSWTETGIALNDINCGYFATKPTFDPNPTEILLNFLTDEDCLVTKNCSYSDSRVRKHVWAQSNADSARVYDRTDLPIYFDW